MSRIGNNPISIPSGVEIKFESDVVSVKGPKGELNQKIDSSIVEFFFFRAGTDSKYEPKKKPRVEKHDSCSSEKAENGVNA